jgi:hypothetical protein
MQAYERLLLANRAWVKERVKVQSDYFARRADTQTPEFLGSVVPTPAFRRRRSLAPNRVNCSCNAMSPTWCSRRISICVRFCNTPWKY